MFLNCTGICEVRWSEVKFLSHVWLFATPWTVAHHAWDSPGKNTWSGLPFPSPGDPPDPVIKPRSHTLQANSLLAEPQRKCKNTGVGSLSLLQGILLIRGSIPCLLLGRWHWATWEAGCICTVEYYSALKKKETLPYSKTWMNLKDINWDKPLNRRTKTVWFHLYLK